MIAEACAGNEDIAMVFLGQVRPGKYVEFVHSVQPPIPREEKWVLIVSTLFGCPVGCRMCDAGGWYDGKPSAAEIMDQIDYMVERYYPDRVVPVRKFKIQFARMGEPALNPAVLEVLSELPRRYHAPGLTPSISTVAPEGSDTFFRELTDIKNSLYSGGQFQMQFSIHTTDAVRREQWIPVRKWDFARIARFGDEFYQSGDRKITLNFALAEDAPLDAVVLARYFDPSFFCVKLTPVNPTVKAVAGGIANAIRSEIQAEGLPQVKALRRLGYDVIISIGELEENKIGSNCGQYIKTFLDKKKFISADSYLYELQQPGTP